MSFLNHFQHVLNIDGSSKWIWSLDPSGEYIVSSLQNYFDKLVLPQSNDSWMWNPLVPGKLNILAWRVYQGKLPCMDNLFKLGISSSNLCKICHEAPKTDDHIFVGCPVSKDVWLQVCSWWRLLDPSPASYRELLKGEYMVGGDQRLKMFHEAITLVFLWIIWRFRNKKAHDLNPIFVSKTVLA